MYYDNEDAGDLRAMGRADYDAEMDQDDAVLRCPACGHEQAGSEGDECEECGEDMDGAEPAHQSVACSHCGAPCHGEAHCVRCGARVHYDYDALSTSPMEPFADDGGPSALRAASARNPRIFPCPDCGESDVLTSADRALGYCCDLCAERKERGF